MKYRLVNATRGRDAFFQISCVSKVGDLFQSVNPPHVPSVLLHYRSAFFLIDEFDEMDLLVSRPRNPSGTGSEWKSPQPVWSNNSLMRCTCASLSPASLSVHNLPVCSRLSCRQPSGVLPQSVSLPVQPSQVISGESL